MGTDHIQADEWQRQRGKLIVEVIVDVEGLVLILVAPTCHGLKQGFSSWSETEVRLLQGESLLITRPVVSDKALAPWLCRKGFP